jgi:DNA-binding NarL/FixJ family response regulator
MSRAQSADYVAGLDALARGAWTDALEAFEATLRGKETPEALEGLGLAAWFLDRADLVFDSRERCYRLFLERDQPVAAARLAVWIAWDCWAFRGEHAVAEGWFRRARRLLDGHPDCPERAWLEVREGAFCLFEPGDPDRGHALATEGIRVARAVGKTDLEMLGRAVQGLALAMSGAVAEGMKGLDEVNAAIVAGELTDHVAVGLSSCYMIAACNGVRDYDRAAQWCIRLSAYSTKWGRRPLFAFCRTQYASICMWRGTWLEAEQELTAARDELAASRPAMAAEGTVRLAELRRRQGRLSEATALFDESEPHGLAALGHAELAFDRGEFRAAAEQAARYLRRVPAHNRTDRAAGLDLLVPALVGVGDIEGAKTALEELASIATLVATTPLRAAASMAAGAVALGVGDADAARRHFEDAVDLFLESGAPYETARARIELARALIALDRIPEAAQEAGRAIDSLTELKAEHELSRARQLLDSLPQASSPPADPRSREHAGLTKRELEVLRLVADGLNNQAIAERLFVSDHTIHRHLANIFNKLSVSSRAAAVAQAARHGLLR